MDEVFDTFDACKKRWGIEQDQDVNFQRYPEWLKAMPEELAVMVNSLIHVLYQMRTPKAFEREFQLAKKRAEFRRLSIEYGLPQKNVLGFNNTEAL